MPKNAPKNSELNYEEISAQATQAIENTPSAEHVLYAACNLARIYYADLAGDKPIDLSDVTTPWESVAEAMNKFYIFPMEDIEILAEVDCMIRSDRPYKIKTKPDSYISAVISKYFKTKGKQRNCLIVQQALKNKLLQICHQLEIRMPKSKVMAGAWKLDWEPATVKFDAATGKALVIEGFEHLFKLYSKVTHYVYECYRNEKMTKRRKRSTKSKKQSTKDVAVAA